MTQVESTTMRRMWRSSIGLLSRLAMSLGRSICWPTILRHIRRIVVLSTCVIRDLNERVLAPGIASGTCLDGHIDQAIDQGFGLLRCSQSFLVIDAARRVATIRDQHQHLASLPIDQRLGSKVDRVVQRGSAANLHFVDRAVELPQLRRERRHLAHVCCEGIESHRILRANHGVNKSARGLQLETNVFARAGAGIHRQHNREWKLRFLAEDRNLLRNAIFGETKVILYEIADRCTLRIGDRDKHIHQLHIDFKGSFGVLLGAHRGEQNQWDDYGAQESHFASPMLGSALVRSSSGNGSPSAHTTPSVKCSFFQIGTVRLRVSIAKRQASKAAPRCAEATTISTLVSPISSRPSRWMIATSLTL